MPHRAMGSPTTRWCYPRFRSQSVAYTVSNTKCLRPTKSEARHIKAGSATGKRLLIVGELLHGPGAKASVRHRLIRLTPWPTGASGG